MLRGRSALASVFLYSACVLALPARKTYHQDLIKRVNTLKENVADKDWLDCKLYTPTIQDAKKCPSSTLKCFAAEMNVLTKELVDSGLTYIVRLNIVSGLGRLANQLEQTELACRHCEFFTEKNVTMFLEDLLLTLTMMNELYS